LAVTAVGLLISAPVDERRTLFWLPERLEPVPLLPRDRVPELGPLAETLTAVEPETEVEAEVRDRVAPSAVFTTVEAGATMVAPVESKVREPELAESEAEVPARFRAPALAPTAVAVTEAPATAAPVLDS